MIVHIHKMTYVHIYLFVIIYFLCPTYFDTVFFCKKSKNQTLSRETFTFKFGFPMEFVDRRTLSRHNPIPPSQDTVTYPLRCGGNRRLAMVRQSSPISIASRSPSRVPHRESQTTCGQKTLILYTASGYIDQKTKKFVRKGRNACLEELKKKHGVKISDCIED